ncbi:hypothetical protein BWR17_09775 [Phaeobacter inhibens]|nr:hypothetical protein BWR17_09775 [Phaeobacter inhibens]
MLDFVDGIARSESPEAAGRHYITFVQASGAVIAHAFMGLDSSSFRATTLPDWMVESESTEAAVWDSHVPAAIRAGVPMFFWGAEIDKYNPQAKPTGKQIGQERLRLFKQRNAVSFGLKNLDGSTAGAGLGFEDGERLFRLRMAEIGGLLSVATFSAHCRMQQLLPLTKAPSPLSKRQAEILQLLGAGYQLSGVADKLGIADSTVNLHLSQLKKKLGVRTKEQALATALMQGWIAV